MATAYTPILQLALPVTGELQGTWGTVVNDNITSMIEQAIAGLATVSTWTAASHTLTTANGTTDEARCAVLECSGAPGAAATVVCPALSKVYVIKNSVTGGYAVTLKTSAGTGISVPNGSTALLYCDGTNVVSGATYMATLVTTSITDSGLTSGRVTYAGTGGLLQDAAALTFDGTILSATRFAGALNGTVGATTPATVVATQVDITAQGDLRLQDTTGGEYVALQAPATIASSYTLTLPTDDGTAGQALITDGSGVLSWSTSASGDVYGPASATDNAVARFDLTTGKLIQNSVVTIADTTGNMASVGTLGVGAITTSGALTYGGVTLNNAVTGTGNMVLSTSPTLVTPALGTPSSGVVTNLTGTASININGTVGATTPSTGAFTTLSGTGQLTLTNASNYNLYASGVGANFMQGKLGIGSVAGVTVVNLLASNNATGNTGMRGIHVTSAVQSDVTDTYSGFDSVPTTAAAAFTLTTLNHFRASQGTIGAGSTVTNQYGFRAGETLTGATNNYGFYGNIASGTGRFNFYAADTAANVFAGTTSIGGAVGAESLRVTPVASAVNYLNVQGAVTTASPSITAAGSDTNIDIALTPKGTGVLAFGTLTANADAPITGYITIKDSGGTVRKLAIIA